MHVFTNLSPYAAGTRSRRSRGPEPRRKKPLRPVMLTFDHDVLDGFRQSRTGFTVGRYSKSGTLALHPPEGGWTPGSVEEVLRLTRPHFGNALQWTGERQ